MARAKGSNSIIVMDEETTYGADPGSPDGRKLFCLKEGLRSSQELLTDETLTGVRDMTNPDLGDIDVAGSVDVNLSETAHAMLMKHALGPVATSGASDPYTHVIKVGALPIGLVFEKGFPDLATPQYMKFNGCRIARSTFRFPAKGYASATFEIKGSNETGSTTPYDATVTELAYKAYSQSKISIEEGGSAIAIVKDLELTIDNDLDDDGYVVGGGGTRKDLPEGFVIITGKMTAFFESIALYNKAINNTESAIKVTLDKSVSPARSIEFFLPELVYERSTPTVESARGVVVDLSFKAYYENSAEGVSAQITIMNGLATI